MIAGIMYFRKLISTVAYINSPRGVYVHRPKSVLFYWVQILILNSFRNADLLSYNSSSAVVDMFGLISKSSEFILDSVQVYWHTPYRAVDNYVWCPTHTSGLIGERHIFSGEQGKLNFLRLPSQLQTQAQTWPMDELIIPGAVANGNSNDAVSRGSARLSVFPVLSQIKPQAPPLVCPKKFLLFF